MKKSPVIITTLLMCVFLFLSLASFAQTGNITGKVIDKYGKPLAGVTVKIKGTNSITTTNDQGNYTFTETNLRNNQCAISLNKYGVLGWSGPGCFPAALNRQVFTKEFIEANPDAVFATQGSMPRAYFLTASYRF
jgi:CarboxypepD_reg-like domain